MTRETEFTRIKRAVEQEKTKKVQGEARLETLEQEEVRIFEEIKELTSESISTPEELDSITEGLRSSIEKDIEEMKRILEDEGVAY